MDLFESLSHLRKQLGDKRFYLLIDPDYTEEIKGLCDQLIKSLLPTTLTIGDRTYEIINFLQYFLQEPEISVDCQTMFDRAKLLDAHLGQEDLQQEAKACWRFQQQQKLKKRLRESESRNQVTLPVKKHHNW